MQNPVCQNQLRPRIKTTASEETAIALTLAKEGYFSGNPCIVFDSPADIVLQTYHYEMFRRIYEETFTELNKGK